jgi:hypothetical protein
MGRSGSSNGRRYSPREKEQAVRMVRALREELGTSQGTIEGVAEQLVVRRRDRARVGEAG